MKHGVLITLLLVLLYSSANAQAPAGLAGDYSGTLSGMPVLLHLSVAADGTVSGTADNPAARLMGLPCTDIRVNGKSLSFNVPNVQGSWVGFISADGNSLTGTWSQGMPMPLNFVRGVGAPSTPPVPPASAGLTPTAQASGSTCPPTSMANYWDGTSWKPLTLVEDMHAKRDFSFKEAMKRPLNPSGGNTLIERYKGTEAPITLGTQPKFCFNLTINEKPEVIIGSLEVKDGNRQIELTRSDRYNTGAMIPAKNSIELAVTRTSNTSFEATPKQPLPAGQYLINEKGALNFDFGVK